MGEYVKKKKNMKFQSVEALQQVVNVVNEAAAALDDPKRTIRESAIPEVLAGAVGGGIGGTISFSIILISIDCLRFSEVKTSRFRKCRLPLFGSLDFLPPNEVFDIDFGGAALALLLALNQPHLVQFGKEGNRFAVAAAHRAHRFLQGEVDEHPVLFVQPAVAYGKPHTVQHQAI